MKLTLEQQKENEKLVNSYMEILRVFRKFERLNKFVPLQERACKIMQHACKSNHDLSKLTIILGDYLVKKFNAM